MAAQPSRQFPFRLRSQPGIKRDGTLYEGRNYTDGLWCRFQRGKPRKMGGYRASSSLLNGIPRGLSLYPSSAITYAHSGWYGGVDQLQIAESGLALAAPVSRTPAGFVSSTDNTWCWATMYNSAGTNTAIIGVAVPDLTNIANTTRRAIWYGDVTATSALVQLAGTDVPASTASGVCFVAPYLFVYDLDGYVTWSAPNDPTDFSTASGGGGPTGGRISSTKVVYGTVSRGGASNSPAAIFWTLDSVVRANFVGGTAIFAFDTVSADTSIISKNAVIEYDGVYYWAGLDRFLRYNGVVQEMPNNMNLNWFFDGMNWDHHEKTFSFKTPRFGEIGWAYPRIPNTEPSHAVIYNVREDSWYDTELPNGGRSCATFAQIVRYPMMGGVQAASGKYRLWQHEFGNDEVVGASTNAIRSYFETSNWALIDDSMAVASPMDKQITIDRIEPDFNLAGALTITVRGRSYAMSPDIVSRNYTFDPANFDDENFETFVQYVREQRRELRVRFENNVVGGFYEMGDVVGLLGIGDGHT